MKRVVYLLHFDRPYRHCLHYLGSTTDVARRIKEHTRGQGKGLMRALYDNHIGFRVVKVFHRKRVKGRFISGYELEYYLKYKIRSNKRLCPICNHAIKANTEEGGINYE